MKLVRLGIFALIFALLFSISFKPAEAAEKSRTIYLYHKTPLYKSNSTASARIATLAPQTISVFSKYGDFYKVRTSKGRYWIHPSDFKDEYGRHRIYIATSLSLYTAQSSNSEKKAVIEPQYITVLAASKSWLKVESTKGTGWVNLAEKLKVAYLTIDDGPSKYTGQILDILKKKNAKATFFAIEPNIRAYKTNMIRVNREGHYIGLHSVSHNATKLYKGSSQNVAREMEITRKTLRSVVGVNHYLTRVPYGSKPYMTKSFRDWLVKYNFKMWDWTIDSNDWRYSTSQYTTIIRNVKSGVLAVEKQKEPIIILVHERPQTVKALPQIIDYLKARGYTLVTYNPSHHVVSNFWNDGRL
ncbi:polysaccharide deacetylase [Metabacillus sp. GX 13764]|uniref:polysaccharide deacetylase family protein n=1 Tax=Metabacillus kandeliae TaxID=2900151 RepID=UPI001E5DC135|nr:polysaccharide deacetylase family protein [Metabacillus kandeliae]MCD7034263.1 polysaccharide deacetylase [Metabacillus kandeliae]